MAEKPNADPEHLTTTEQEEIRRAAAVAKAAGPARDVRQWLQDVSVATLSTLSSKTGLEGFPACSVVPFALDADGAPFILIAQIAAHTRNLREDNRASLFIRQGKEGGDPQAQWRATLSGYMEKLVTPGDESKASAAGYETLISEGEFQELRARYRERVPASDGYFKTHDFHFWRMKQVEQVRYIAGFGRICWFDGQELLSSPMSEDLASVADGAIHHMNDDHRDAMAVMCEALHGFKSTHVRMTSLDRRGFFMSREGTPDLLYTSFGHEIDAKGLRAAMVNITKKARLLGSEKMSKQTP